MARSGSLGCVSDFQTESRVLRGRNARAAHKTPGDLGYSPGARLSEEQVRRSAASVADDRAKLRLVPKRRKVVVARRSLAQPVRQVRGAANMLDRVGRSARQRFAAREVVEQERRVREL